MFCAHDNSALQAGGLDVLLRGGRGGRGRRGRNFHKQKRGNYGKKSYRHKKKENRAINPELIDDKKIFVFGLPVQITEDDLKNVLSKWGKILQTTIIKSGKPKNYGFITVESEETTQRILNLRDEERKVNGFYFGVKPGTLQFKVPGMPGFQRAQLSEREFELQPEDPNKVTIHMLIDDVLLKIMDFLPLRDLLRIDAVCRRWQSLVHASFRSKIPAIMEDNLNTWLSKNIINPTLPVISKVLLLSGESLSTLSVTDRDLFKGRLLKIISQLCPSLENLTVDMLYQKSIPFLRDFIVCCPHLKSFKCTQSMNITDEDLSFLLVNLQNLETLHVEGTLAFGKFLTKLPDSIQILELPMCRDIQREHLTEIYTRCPLLKVLGLDDTECPRNFLIELGTKCQYLTELSLTCEYLPDFHTLTNLKSLSYNGISKCNINSLLSSLPPDLEVLNLQGGVQESESELVDFSVMKNLKVLSLPMYSWKSLSIQSIKTISHCPNLVSFRYKGTNDHKPAILEIIRRCQNLKEIECMGVTLSEEDLSSFVEANKKRVGVLKFTVGLNRSGMDIIEKFNEGNYEVNMFDVDNIFGEDSVTYTDDDDDGYDFYDGFMSEEDYDSDNLFDFDEFDEDDFLYYNSYGLVHPWEVLFDALDSPHGYEDLDSDTEGVYF